jgi:hypothetical protein
MVVWGVITKGTFSASPPASLGPIATKSKSIVAQYLCLWYLLRLARLYEGREVGWLSYQSIGTQHEQVTTSSMSSRPTPTHVAFRRTSTAPRGSLVILFLGSISLSLTSLLQY